MNEIKLALTGAMRSGKSSVATILCADYGFHEIAFGDALKRLAHEVFPDVPREPKPRALYQQFGQAMRNMPVPGAADVWVEHAMNRVEFWLDQAAMSARRGDGAFLPRVVISDLRQPNEFDRCRAEGFTIIRVMAPANLRLARARRAGDDFTEADLAHETEQYVDEFAVDYEIVNDSDIDDLVAKVSAIMAELGVTPIELPAIGNEPF